METFEEWLDRLPVLALHELAGGGYDLRKLTVAETRAYVRAWTGPWERALESWKIERAAIAAVAAMDPWEVRDRKIRYGLID